MHVFSLWSCKSMYKVKFDLGDHQIKQNVINVIMSGSPRRRGRCRTSGTTGTQHPIGAKLNTVKTLSSLSPDLHSLAQFERHC